MGEVTRFFLCTTNITGCKIVGGIQAVLNAVFLGLVIYAHHQLVNDQLRLRIGNPYYTENKFYQASASAAIVCIITMVIYSLAILISLMLIAGAMKRNSCLVKTWMVFNGLAILAFAYESFFKGEWKNLGVLAVALWSELIAFGALKDINILNTTSNLPQTQSGAPPNPQAQSGLPYPMTEFGAPPLPTLQQPSSHI